MAKTKCAIIGSGNIGTDLMVKILRGSSELELAVVVGIDPASEGLAMARARGVTTTHEGIDGLRALTNYPDIELVFDATSASAHVEHAKALAADGKLVVDLTPAARSEAHTSALQSLMRNSYAVFRVQKNKITTDN